MKTPLIRMIFTAVLVSWSSQGAFAQMTDDKPFSLIEAQEFLAEAARKARENAAGLSFEEFKDTVPKEPFEGGKYIVNGDTTISTEADLLSFYISNIANSPTPRTELAVGHIDGEDVIWDGTQKTSLTYCVSDEFENEYNQVVTAMNNAANAWEAAADIEFIHVTEQDADCDDSNFNVLFDVRPVNFGIYLARAFFPNEERDDRNILIDDASFDLTGDLNLTGILRHELGHVLGFRHEHTRPDAGICFEDDEWRGVTDYDMLSVMHYPWCNGQEDSTLTLTSSDQNGSACLYGPRHRLYNRPNDL